MCVLSPALIVAGDRVVCCGSDVRPAYHNSSLFLLMCVGGGDSEIVLCVL